MSDLQIIWVVVGILNLLLDFLCFSFWIKTGDTYCFTKLKIYLSFSIFYFIECVILWKDAGSVSL